MQKAWTKQEENKVKVMYDKGKPYNEISEVVGRSIKALEGLIYRKGWKRDKEEIANSPIELKKTLKGKEAKIRILNRTIKVLESEVYMVDRIVSIVKDSILSLPKIKAPDLIVPDINISDEIAVLVLSDLHIGKKTVSFNTKVLQNRMNKLKKNMFSILSQLRSVRPIKKLVILFNGDLVDNESIYPGQTEGIVAPVVNQIFSIGLPMMLDFISFCLQNFEEVEIRAVMGNHGKINQAKWVSSRTTNWDLVFYKALSAVTQNEKRLKWHISEEWKDMFRINSWGFFMTHGNQFRSQYGMPWYSMVTKSLKWQITYASKIKLSYFIYSHFHTIGCGFRANQLVIFNNGSAVTDDDYAEEKIGTATIPEQLFLGVHSKRGVSWRYSIALQ